MNIKDAAVFICCIGIVISGGGCQAVPTDTSVEATSNTSVSRTVISEISSETSLRAGETLEILLEPPSCEIEYDDNRYGAYFTDQYMDTVGVRLGEDYASSLMFCYSDLDRDGDDELLIGDSSGIYAVVSEDSGIYTESLIWGFNLSQGPVGAEYIGSEYFLCYVHTGNQGQFYISNILRYDGDHGGCGEYAYLTGYYGDIGESGSSETMWELYIANDPSDLMMITGDETMDPEDPGYTYTMLPYGDYAIGRAEDPLLDELENSFDEQVADIRESASDLTYLEWRSAGDMLEE